MTDLPFNADEQMALERTGPGAMVPDLPKAFTGARLTETEKTTILAKKAAGKTNSEIASELGMSRNTVSAEIRRAEKDGRLPSMKERLSEKMLDLVEEHVDLKLREPGKMTALDAAIYFDKSQIMVGAPTAILTIARREDEAVILEDLKRLSEGFIDVEATPVLPPCLPTPPTT